MSELSLWVIELREALAAEWAEPLPCSGLQALNRSRRVFLAERAVFRHLTRSN